MAVADRAACQAPAPDRAGRARARRIRQGGRYSIKLFADDLIALLDALGVERAVVCGHSMGGTVAQVIAADYPDRVIGVILAETNYGVGNDPMMRLAAAATTAVARLIGVGSFVRMAARSMKASDPQIVAAIQASFRAHEADPDNVRNIIDAMNAYDGSAILSRIRCPALVIAGADNRLSRKQSEFMAQAIPDARLVSIPNAGHGANWDNAPAFNAAVLDFVRGLPTP